MKRAVTVFLLFSSCVFLLSCSRSKDQVWDDSQSCSHYMARGVRCLGGKHGDSRQVNSREEFLCREGAYSAEDFVPLEDEEGSIDWMVGSMAPPKERPGEPGSAIPGIDGFRDPSTVPEIASLFQNIHFGLDSHYIRGENLRIARDVAEYLKAHPNCYLFISGHCDERGPEAYNLALGTRRARSIYDFLVKEGISSDNLFTVSYGKEHPLVLGHNEEAWSQNRRGEFRVYYR